MSKLEKVLVTIMAFGLILAILWWSQLKPRYLSQADYIPPASPVIPYDELLDEEPKPSPRGPELKDVQAFVLPGSITYKIEENKATKIGKIVDKTFACTILKTIFTDDNERYFLVRIEEEGFRIGNWIVHENSIIKNPKAVTVPGCFVYKKNPDGMKQSGQLYDIAFSCIILDVFEVNNEKYYSIKIDEPNFKSDKHIVREDGIIFLDDILK
ncbi:MAG: hypothetical protein DWQ19_11505 [Crenarchaeota archaeon]|nr:MAG: hypothetical protein DWQ19_11505 [Thermoproteota archaeon]